MKMKWQTSQMIHPMSLVFTVLHQSSASRLEHNYNVLYLKVIIQTSKTQSYIKFSVPTEKMPTCFVHNERRFASPVA